MDIKMLSKRYSTPGYVKVIGTILFPAAFILIVVMPVFELIPQDQFMNVFNAQWVATGSSYTAEQLSMFTMLANDYGSGPAMGIFMAQCILSVIAGVALLWVNRPKLAAIPAAVMLWSIVFSVFRSPAHLYTGKEFWGTADATDFVSVYTKDGVNSVFHTLGNYWMLWVCGIVLLAFAVFAIVSTKTLIEKKK